MSRSKRTKWTTVFAAALALSSVAWFLSPQSRAQNQISTADGEAMLQQLLTDAGLFFQRQELQNGRVQFRVAIDAGGQTGQTSMISLRVNAWTWKRPDGSPAYSVYGFTQVQAPAEGRPFSAAAAQKVCEYNDTLWTGNCSISSEGVYANTGFFLPVVDADTFANYVYALHWNSLGLKEALAPILAAEAAEN
jgi:hypothetical protein